MQCPFGIFLKDSLTFLLEDLKKKMSTIFLGFFFFGSPHKLTTWHDRSEPKSHSSRAVFPDATPTTIPATRTNSSSPPSSTAVSGLSQEGVWLLTSVRLPSQAASPPGQPGVCLTPAGLDQDLTKEQGLSEGVRGC